MHYVLVIVLRDLLRNGPPQTAGKATGQCWPAMLPVCTCTHVVCWVADAHACCCDAALSCLQVRVDFDQPGLPRRVKQSGKWLSQNVLTKSKKK